jgi:hypothetical protein
MNATARNTAGQLQAGSTIAANDSDDLLALIEGITTTADGVCVVDFLRERGEATAGKIGAHAAVRDSALLRGDAAQASHEAEAARLQREADRLALAVDRATARVSEVAAQERQTEGEAAAARAMKTAATLEKRVADYVAAARAVAALFERIEVATAELNRDRDIARSAGVECVAQLPHEARFRPELVEEREVIDRSAGPAVRDAEGRSLDGKPVRYVETRRMEHVITQQRHAPRPVIELRAVLPDPDGGFLLNRNPDATGRRF